MPRLLLCKSCGILHNMNDYDGDVQYDMELIDTIDRHLQQAEDPRPESHMSMIIRCDPDTASKLDMETEVKKELMDNEVEMRYARDGLKEDAIKCFNQHDRPNAGCIDYEDESKTIGRKTGVPKSKRQYLCYFCPAHEYAVHKIRGKAGLYSTTHDTHAGNGKMVQAIGRKPKSSKSGLWTPGNN